MVIDVRGTSQQAKSEGQAFLIEDIAGINTQADRSAIDDKELSWSQNWMPIGKGNFRTTYAEKDPIYSASGKAVIRHFPYNIGAITYIAVFFGDGTAIQVRESDGAVTPISSTTNKFYQSGSSIPDCTQWQSKYLIIASDVTTNGYDIWDGVSLYSSGGLAPIVTVTDGGSGYTSAPTVTAYGGSGTGATFIATVANGSVTEVTMLTPGSGYLITDQIVLGFSGGGSDSSAVAHATVTTSSGGVSDVLVLTGGDGASSTSVGSFAGGGGSDAAAVISSAVNGVVTGVTVTNPGTGYTSEPTLTFNNVGTGPTFNVIITKGQVTAITVDVAGSGFTGDPIVTITGDGSGATATATISAGAVSAINIVSAGTGYSYAKVELSGGNNAAAATVSLMPFGVSGNTLETYQARVWIANGTTSQVTAPESVSVFAASAGGSAYPATDSFLRNRITKLAAANGFLYQFGDSSVDVISNVQTNGTPPTTTFNIENVDPQTGTPWRDSVQALGRALVFANSTGVYALYGGAAQKVSDQLDGLFANASFSTGAAGVTPSASVATFYGIRSYIFLLTTINPYTNAQANVVLGWTGQKWFPLTQLRTPITLSQQEIDSELSAWASDGIDLFHMFDTPSDALLKVFQTKLRPDPTYLDQKRMDQIGIVARNNTVNAAVINLSVDNENQTGANPKALSFQNTLTFIGLNNTAIQFIGAGGLPLDFVSGGRAIRGYNPGAGGYYLGFTGTSNAEDLTLISITGVYSPARTNA